MGLIWPFCNRVADHAVNRSKSGHPESVPDCQVVCFFTIFDLLVITTMRRSWLLFSQLVTVMLAAYFVVVSLKPQWLEGGRRPGSVTVIEAPTSSTAKIAGGAPGSFSAAAKAASGAVVSINASKAAARQPTLEDPWFRFFFGDQVRSQTQIGLGSGVIVSASGYILTNNHVVEGADDIEVILIDTRRATAKVIGTDPETDLAILKIELDDLPVIVLGSSETLEIGDQVLAIGNPFGVGQTVTSGIISALGRSQLGINVFENFIQTDAAINPGNSGGALVDTQGRLLGINTAIYSRSGGSMGIGFAIPVSTARQVLESIVKDGQVTRGWIGVEPRELNAELAQTFNISAKSGVIITGVLQNGPAAVAGIRPGDVITAVADKPVGNVTELLSAVAALKPGLSATLKVQRRETYVEIVVKPSKRQQPALPR
jgi:Do/DeqQ family serine protease